MLIEQVWCALDEAWCMVCAEKIGRVVSDFLYSVFCFGDVGVLRLINLTR